MSAILATAGLLVTTFVANTSLLQSGKITRKDEMGSF